MNFQIQEQRAQTWPMIIMHLHETHKPKDYIVKGRLTISLDPNALYTKPRLPKARLFKARLPKERFFPKRVYPKR